MYADLHKRDRKCQEEGSRAAVPSPRPSLPLHHRCRSRRHTGFKGGYHGRQDSISVSAYQQHPVASTAMTKHAASSGLGSFAVT